MEPPSTPTKKTIQSKPSAFPDPLWGGFKEGLDGVIQGNISGWHPRVLSRKESPPK
ncbi:MAG: hypothetical protein AABW68_04075 [archaeon]